MLINYMRNKQAYKTQKLFFSRNARSNLLTPKRHILVRNTFDYCAWKSVKGPGLWTVKRTRKTDVEYPWCPISHIRGKETPCGIMIKFRIWVDIRGVMTYGMQLMLPIGYGVWVWCAMTLSIIKLLTFRSAIWHYQLEHQVGVRLPRSDAIKY